MTDLSQLQAADPTASMCAYLQAEVGSLLGRNSDGEPAVYRPQVPLRDEQLMPQAAIAVRAAGGFKLFQGSRLPVSDPALDILCFGSVRMESEDLARAVVLALKRLSMVQWENTMLYWAKASGPLPIPDTQTLWPTTVVTAQVMHADYSSASPV